MSSTGLWGSSLISTTTRYLISIVLLYPPDVYTAGAETAGGRARPPRGILRGPCQPATRFLSNFYRQNGRRRVVSEARREVERQVSHLVLNRRVGVRPEQ